MPTTSAALCCPLLPPRAPQDTFLVSLPARSPFGSHLVTICSIWSRVLPPPHTRERSFARESALLLAELRWAVNRITSSALPLGGGVVVDHACVVKAGYPPTGCLSADLLCSKIYPGLPLPACCWTCVCGSAPHATR